MLVLSLGFLIGDFLERATFLASVERRLPGAPLLSGALRCELGIGRWELTRALL
jgi:hypothetical protein